MFILTVGPYYDQDIRGYSHDKSVLERHANDMASHLIRERYRSKLFYDYKHRPENLHRLERVPLVQLRIKTPEMTSEQRRQINKENGNIREQNAKALDPVQQAIDEEARAYAESLVDTQKITQEMIDHVKREDYISIEALKELT